MPIIAVPGWLFVVVVVAWVLSILTISQLWFAGRRVEPSMYLSAATLGFGAALVGRTGLAAVGAILFGIVFAALAVTGLPDWVHREE